MDLPVEAAHVLCRAYREEWGEDGHLYLIDRALGYKTWETNGAKGRRDIAPLYAAGLVAELHSPWSSPMYLTDEGVSARKKYRKELGYER